jgi:hypothetical protein
MKALLSSAVNCALGCDACTRHTSATIVHRCTALRPTAAVAATTATSRHRLRCHMLQHQELGAEARRRRDAKAAAAARIRQLEAAAAEAAAALARAQAAHQHEVRSCVAIAHVCTCIIMAQCAMLAPAPPYVKRRQRVTSARGCDDSMRCSSELKSQAALRACHLHTAMRSCAHTRARTHRLRSWRPSLRAS